MTSQTLHFQIHGDFVTDHIRNLYKEGSIVKAWNTFATITEDLDIFRDIIKGRKTFEGVNEFELIDCKKEDISDSVLYYLVSNLTENKEYLEKANTQMNSPVKYLDDEEMTLGEYIEYKHGSLKQLKKTVLELEENLAMAKKIFNYTEDDVISSCLKKYAAKDVTSKYGWITEKGWFLPVSFAGHDQFIEDFNEQMKTTFSVAQIEKRWVRITMAMCGTISVSAYNFNLKPKQALTLEKWMLHHNAVKDGDSFSIYGYGEAERNGNKIKFTRYSED